MGWDDYNLLREALERDGAAASLDRLQRAVAAPGELLVPLSGLLAQAYELLGRPQDAAALLRALIEAGLGDFWTHHLLAGNLRALGDLAGCAEQYRRSHALHGWPESARHGYVFTHDYFAAKLDDWRGWFRDQITAAPLAALEIGSWQGASAAWLLDAVIGPRGGRLTCIDTFAGSSEHASAAGAALPGLQAAFDANIARTGRAAQVRKLVGASQQVLPRLAGERFDFIFIDGAHEAKYVIQDAVLCWGLLPVGGFMLFDDVEFRFADRPAQDTRHAIAAFCRLFAEDIAVLAEGRELLLRRIGE